MSSLFVPRPYQAAGLELALSSEVGCYLAFAPGSGKTATAMLAADHLMHMSLEHGRTLIVGPRLVAEEVWTREVTKWSQLEHLDVGLIPTADFGYTRVVTTHTVGDVAIDETKVEPRDIKAARARILARQETILTVSRDNFWWLVKILGKRWPFDLVIWDEATSLKTHDSKRSKALRYLRAQGLVKRVILLSGTPIPKSLEQYWAQIRQIDGGARLGATLTEFRARFMTPDARNKDRVFSWKARVGAREEVLKLTSDIALSVPASVWRETEEPLIVRREVTLPSAARDLYRTMERDLLIEINGMDILAPQAAVLGSKLLQLASGAVFDSEKDWHSVHDAKLDSLAELIEELDGEPLLVLYWYQPTLERLKARFGKRLHTTKSKGFLDRFGKDITLLALHPASAGHGLDGLQNGGHHVALVDMFFDWECANQAVARLDRSGQKHQVVVHQIIAKDTRDERVARVLLDREANQAAVMQALRF